MWMARSSAELPWKPAALRTSLRIRFNMLFLIILLSVAMVIDCVILVFLVLMQLPKKEAGVGLAFGGAATDALFGAGSGNFLTKATKYTAGIFFAFAILLSVLQNWRAHQSGSE